MDPHLATEIAYKNGYNEGYQQAAEYILAELENIFTCDSMLNYTILNIIRDTIKKLGENKKWLQKRKFWRISSSSLI